MIQGVSPEMMRAYAQYTPDGRATDKDRENSRKFQLILREEEKCSERATMSSVFSGLLVAAFTFVKSRPRNPRRSIAP